MRLVEGGQICWEEVGDVSGEENLRGLFRVREREMRCEFGVGDKGTEVCSLVSDMKKCGGETKRARQEGEKAQGGSNNWQKQKKKARVTQETVSKARRVAQMNEKREKRSTKREKEGLYV